MNQRHLSSVSLLPNLLYTFSNLTWTCLEHDLSNMKSSDVNNECINYAWLRKMEEDGEVRVVTRVVYYLVAKLDDGGAWRCLLATEGSPEEKRLRELKDLTPEEKLRKSYDIKATNIILLGLPVDIYTLVNHHKTTKEIWDMVKELMEGTELTLHERESKLYDDFDRFTSEKGESFHLYYLRYAMLIYDMNVIGMTMTPIQINTKFVNHLQPEWSKFVTSSKVTVQNIQGHQSQGYGVNTSKSQYTGTRVINTVGDVNANQPRVIRCYNCKGEAHIVKQCTAKKRVKALEWLEEIDSDCEDLQLCTTSNFKADHVDAYDSDCNYEATTSAIFMASVSPVGSINGDTVVQEMEYIQHLVSNNDSYDELTSDNNVISYADYMVINAMILSVIEQMQSQVEQCNTVNQETKSVNESLTINELKQLLATLKGKSQVTSCETPDIDSRIQKLDDENVSLAFKVSSFEKEREHLKITLAIVVSPGQILTTTVIPSVESSKPSKQRYDNARNSLTQPILIAKATQ
ncbi:hypothetical protein Tco_0392764 [Tanacetum coccineum]